MQRPTKLGLMRFLTPSDAPMSILVVETTEYLPLLRVAFPNASLAAVTADRDAPQDKDWRELKVSWHILDYTEEPLPFPHESFDYIVSEHFLELAGNPQDIASGFSRYIKETGALLTSFGNIRWWRILDELRDGHFYALARRLFARVEFETLLYASFYKEVFFLAEKDTGREDVLDAIEQAGFTDREDMETENWLVIAYRSVREVRALKERYTPQLRRALVTLLRRIEYGIDIEENRAALKKLCEDECVDEVYVQDFAAQTVVQRDAFYKNLGK